MTNSAWVIRFYNPIADETHSYIGSLANIGARYQDDIVAFSGLYGMDYMLWYTKKTLTDYDFKQYALNLRLLLHGNPRAPYFEENYRVSNVWYNTDIDKYVIFCKQEDSIILDTLLIEYGVTTVNYNEKRTPKEVLKDVLEDNGIIGVKFHEHDKYKSFKYEYRTLTIKPDWTVKDFITYIANENKYEWAFKNGLLHIGPEIKTIREANAKILNPNEDVVNISNSPFCMKVTADGFPVDLLYNWNEEKRCVWVKHYAGGKGDTTKACFVNIGEGRFPLDQYVDTLEGDLEREKGRERIAKQNRKFEGITIGNILTDEGELEYIDKVSTEKDVDYFPIKTPRNILINKKNPVFLLEKIGRTTQYLDNGKGLLFPNVADPANSVIFNPEGRIESAVVGPFVMGNGNEEYVIPEKNAGDFRLQLNNGWCLYVDENGNTILQTDSMDAESIPSEDTTKTHIKLSVDGTVDINTNNKNVTINQGGIAVSTENHTHSLNSHTHMFSPIPMITIPASATTQGPNPSRTDSDPDKISKNFRVEEA